MTSPARSASEGLVDVNLPSDRWPPEPYKGLAYYGALDRPLFSGRERDVDACLRRVTSADARILLVHGRTGCGKSSFLRAGLIPELEESHAYHFMYGNDGSPVFIRCGSDPIGKIAERLYEFASKGTVIKGEKGPVHYDLSAALLGTLDVASYVEVCRQFGRLRESLYRISSILPCTFVVVLDQAEEVIALADPSRDHQREFFHFIRELGLVKYPIKLIVALRTDYSGTFIELGSLGGGVDLGMLTENPRAIDVPEVLVRSGLRLYFLEELERAKVRQAIELPTEGHEKPNDKNLPFSKYRFSYQPQLVDEIVEDLFKMSSTAVLPEMQIVCLELYREATGRSKGENRGGEGQSPQSNLPAIISQVQYRTRGRIAGPVDRHISNALRGSFDSRLRLEDAAKEEDKWREVLFRLVRLESDGTAHTRILDERAIREAAQFQGVRTELGRVIEFLTRPDVLLLRWVSPDSGGLPKLSLGHDFLALVLSQWKVARQAEQQSRERYSQMLRRFALVGGLFMVGVVALSLVIFSAQRYGTTKAEYGVLLNSATSEHRKSPMTAVLASAYATIVADKLQQTTMIGARRNEADILLAGLLAGLPDEEPGSDVRNPGNLLLASETDFALPFSKGFLAIRGDIVTLTAGKEVSEFRLQPYDKQPAVEGEVGGLGAYSSVSVSEVDKDVVLLLRVPTVQPLNFQLYVLRAGERGDGAEVRPLGIENFKRGIPWLNNPTELREEGLRTRVQLSGPLIVFHNRYVSQTSRDGPHPEGAFKFRLQAFAFGSTESRPPRGSDPTYAFRKALGLNNLHLDETGSTHGGVRSPQFFQNFVVLPEVSTAEARGIAGLTKYDMLNSEPKANNHLTGKSFVLPCGNDCTWQWATIYGDQSAIVFTAQNEGAVVSQGPMNSADSVSVADFRKLLIVELSSGRETVVETKDLRGAIENCYGHNSKAHAPSARWDLASARPFVLAGASGPLLGLKEKQSIELVQVSGVPAAVSCKGSFHFRSRLDNWIASRDGSILLGVGPYARATWSLSDTFDARKARLIKEGKLRERACNEIRKGSKSGQIIEQDLDFELAAISHLSLSGPIDSICSEPPK